MFNIRLADGHLYGKQLFNWLLLVVSFMASFVLSFFPLDVLDGIWDLIESVSEGFLTYSYKCLRNKLNEESRVCDKICTKFNTLLYCLFFTKYNIPLLYSLFFTK